MPACRAKGVLHGTAFLFTSLQTVSGTLAKATMHNKPHFSSHHRQGYPCDACAFPKLTRHGPLHQIWPARQLGTGHQRFSPDRQIFEIPVTPSVQLFLTCLQQAARHTSQHTGRLLGVGGVRGLQPVQAQVLKMLCSPQLSAYVAASEGASQLLGENTFSMHGL